MESITDMNGPLYTYAKDIVLIKSADSFGLNGYKTCANCSYLQRNNAIAG